MIADKIIRYGSFLAPGIASLFPDRTWKSISDVSFTFIIELLIRN